ncbi:MAG: hypothetical protein NVS3B21_05210 [Acidimicrobiales bacterium]
MPPGSIVIGCVTEPVVGVEKDLLDEATDVAASGGVDVLAAFSTDGHEACEAELGEMLTGRRRGRPSHLGERTDVSFS